MPDLSRAEFQLFSACHSLRATGKSITYPALFVYFQRRPHFSLEDVLESLVAKGYLREQGGVYRVLRDQGGKVLAAGVKRGDVIYCPAGYADGYGWQECTIE